MLVSNSSTERPRYLFVGGLHRSGTSLAARMIATLPGVAQITDAPVPENEGVYLQGAIPHDALAGRPMHFATDPEQHLTETHPLNRLETRLRLEADWAPWFGPGRWRIEKSPVNMTRMRLLQQLFPLAQFVILLRHPEAVAAAVAKWIDEPSEALIDHWLDAHDRMLEDVARLHSVVVVHYEYLTAHPDSYLGAMAAFLDIAHPYESEMVGLSNRNTDYRGCRPLTPEQATRAARWGYSPGLVTAPDWPSIVRHPLRDIREATAQALGTV